MTQILTEMKVNEGLQNVFNPLPLKMHIGLCILATILYLIQYYRKGSWHYLLLMIGIDLTYLTQTNLCYKKGFIPILGVAEGLILLGALLTYLSFAKKEKAKHAAAAAAADEADERRKNVEKEQAKLDKNVVDSAFEDGE